MKSIPNTWRSMTVADVCDLRNGHSFGPEDWDTAGLPIIRIQNLNGGRKFDYFSGVPEDRWLVDPGQMLFSWAGTKGVSFGPTIWRGARGVLNQHIFKVQAKSGIDSEWLYWALKHVTNRIEAQSHGFKATLVHVKKSDIDRQPLTVPPIGEQHRIAEILSTWDQSIATAKRLLANSQRCTRDLMASMLSGHRRFPGFSEKWRYVDFDSVFERVKRKNTTQNANVLTISGERGLISQREYFNKSVASADLSGYTLLHRYDFAYNKSYSAGYPMGAIKALLRYDAGVVSSLYLCFRLRADVDADLDFFSHYFEAGMMNQQIEGIAQEGARNHGLLNVSVTDFFKLQLHLPSAPEQRRIAEVINLARAEEARLQAQVHALRQERAVLISQLLTGKRRVKLPDVETEAQA